MTVGRFDKPFFASPDMHVKNFSKKLKILLATKSALNESLAINMIYTESKTACSSSGFHLFNIKNAAGIK